MGTFPPLWDNGAISAALDPSGAYQHCTFEYPNVGILQNRLYLDSGETRMMVGDSPQKSFYETNPRILWVDLSVPFDYSNYTIFSRSKPDTVPSLALGAGFTPSDSSASKLFRFAGYYPSNNESALHYEEPAEHMEEVGLTWSYDVLSDVWIRELNAGIQSGLAGGSSTTNAFLNEAYYLGGGQDSWILQDAPDFFVEDMVVLNMSDATWRNETVPGPGLYGAMMEYLPVGEKGALVLFGGTTVLEGPEGPSDGLSNPMDPIRIYDIASRTWYSQNATGAGTQPLIPDARILGCTASISAPDNSSYNIYLFGGQQEVNGARTKDLWILSLPSFTWIKATDDSTGGVGHTCRRVGRQMLAIGSGEQDENTCQPFFRILDMSTLEWTNTYSPHPADYVVPPPIHAAIGGDEAGGARLIEPARDDGDWTALKSVFDRTPWGVNAYFNPTDDTGTTTGMPPSPSASSGTTPGTSTSPRLPSSTIAGIVLGSVAGLVLITVIAYWIWRRRLAKGGTRGKPRTFKVRARHEVVNNTQASELHGRAITPELPVTPKAHSQHNVVVIPGVHELGFRNSQTGEQASGVKLEEKTR